MDHLRRGLVARETNLVGGKRGWKLSSSLAAMI